ncbi:MAG: dipeptide epimerase [Candidatus Marinimicrobia bacterium]|nr:dipeptide epimerase [Candidatus Neomarinimicrobiota bacterium]
MKRREFFETIGLATVAVGVAGSIPGISCSSKRVTTEKGMNVKFEVKRLNLTHTWTISRNSSNYKDDVFVYLEKDGIIGIGEAAPNIRYNETPESTIEVIKKSIPLFEKCNPWEYVQLSYDIKSLTTAQTAAKAALDIALMDWIGKALNIPLYRLWGLDHTKLPLTSFSIGIDTPEVVKQKTREAAPYKILKVKVGKKNDKELIEAVRSVAPDKLIRVDANEGWKDKEIAIKEIEWLMKNGVEFIEQPMPSEMLEETRWLRDRVEVPIIADEAVKTASDIPKLAEAYDGINIKIMKAGGLQEALRMIWLAKSLNMKIMIGCMIESSVGVSAAAQLSSLIDYADLDGNLLISNDPYEGVKVIDGKLVLSDRPGIGVKEV